jgi:hypothetical protein
MIFSPYSNNPDDGFEIMPNGTLRARAGQGYWVLTIEEAREKLWNKGDLG